MKPETIKAMFTNILFVIGVGLLIYGFVRGSLTITHLLAFEKYPLNSYEETQCDMQYYPMREPAVIDGEKPVMNETDPSIEDEEKQAHEEQKARCKTALERQRRVRKTEDLVVPAAMLIAGGVLVYSFRKSMFK